MTRLNLARALIRGSFFILFLIASNVGCGTQGDESDRLRSSPATAITQSSPPWTKLAVIQFGSPQPPADMLARFQAAFNRLEGYCPDTSDRIGDFIVVGQR